MAPSCISMAFFWNPVAWLHHCTFSLLSPHPADPTLTTGNLMEVVKGLETRWKDLAGKLYVRDKKITEIENGYHDEIRRMEEYVRYYPLRSWDGVASALRRMGLHQQGDVVIAKYVRGI